MKKVIVKSVIITAILLVAVAIISIFTLTTFFPQTVSDLAFKVNDKKTCVKYQEKAYLKDNSFSNLVLLTERAIWADDDEKVVIYAEKFIADENFNSYATQVDESYAYYITSSYVISLYDEGYITKSIETAFNESNGFENLGPVHSLIAYAVNKSDKATLTTIKQKLTNYRGDAYATYLISVIDEEINKL